MALQVFYDDWDFSVISFELQTGKKEGYNSEKEKKKGKGEERKGGKGREKDEGKKIRKEGKKLKELRGRESYPKKIPRP